MTPAQAKEILEIWEDSSNDDEAFDSFAAESVEPEHIKEVLGASVERGFNLWVYLNLK